MKGNIMRKSRQQSRPCKTLKGQRKGSSRPKRNVCVIRFPRSSYLTTCPLVSWYFNLRMRDDFLSLQKDNPNRSHCMAEAHHKMPLHLGRHRKQRPNDTCSAFLRNALKEVASKKKAKWVVTTSPKRRHYSDKEIFYRLANPSKRGRKENGRPTSDAGAKDAMPPATGISLTTASEVQEALS
ncbi:hypothetical protein JRQ81_007660 [Phrynocephalus forsythii]|uniref:Uncharacterized protein n=1 Tax=Phrynocephalus forsythii TaxID=171643 RepID=A0A9Q1ATH8_9SAUR|nr:hypothetical protein JRQ81_007660 [Phrynocephalus forsythii]